MKKSTTLIGALMMVLLVLTACGGEKSKENTDASELGMDDAIKAVEEAKSAQEKFDIIGRYAFKDDYVSTDINYDLSNATFDADGNVDKSKTPIDQINVNTKLRDNFSQNLMVKNFLRSSTEVLKATKDVQYNNIFIGAMATFTDQYGNENEEYAAKLNIPKSEVDKIDFENFLYGNLDGVADLWVNPSIEYKGNK